MSYTETVTKDGQTSTTVLSSLGALNTLRRGLGYGATVTAAPDGTVTITRTALKLCGEDVIESLVTVTLRSDAALPRLTKRQYEDMKIVCHAGKKAQLNSEGRIKGAFWQIPASAAKRLLGRGLVVVIDQDNHVVAGIAGLMAMAAYEHKARTTAPRGWHDSENGHVNTVRNHRMHPYKTLDRTSAAICACGLRSIYDGRQYAAAAVRKHLAEHLASALTAA